MPRVNTTDEVFKKTEQVVGKPETTKHNINEEYLRNAPQVCPLRLLPLDIALTYNSTHQQNTDHSINQHKQTYPSRRRMSVSAKEGASEGELGRTRMREGSLADLEEAEPHEGLGRQKMEGELAEIAQEDAVHR